MPAPLDDIRVVELASYVAAPAATTLLADLGADVIKVEVPHGEVMRHSTPRRMGFRESTFPEAAHFQMDNRGKRSLALDLTRPEARRALLRVIDGADVVVTNLLPGRLEKYGLDAETLRRDRPGLVFACVSGYGPHGEEANRPAFDFAAYWARTGFMDLMRDTDLPPSYMRGGIGDHATALGLVSGILAALRTRDRTGEGQVVELALMHMGFYILGNDVTQTLVTGRTPPRHDRRKPINPIWNTYETKDGRWLFLVMIESDRYWPSFCRAIGREEWILDPRFDGAVARYRSAEELVAQLDEVFAEHSLEEWRARLDAHSLIWAPAQTVAEAVHDPQARAMGMFSTIEHPVAGPFETVAPPIRMSGHPMPGDRPAPELGEHGEAILREAGLGEDEIADALGGPPED